MGAIHVSRNPRTSSPSSSGTATLRQTNGTSPSFGISTASFRCPTKASAAIRTGVRNFSAAENAQIVRSNISCGDAGANTTISCGPCGPQRDWTRSSSAPPRRPSRCTSTITQGVSVATAYEISSCISPMPVPHVAVIALAPAHDAPTTEEMAPAASSICT